MNKGRVLVVDDEDAIRELIVFNLKQQGFEAIEAADGLEAIRKVEEERPDLVILDLMLPKMDGLEVCQKIRHSRELAKIPIIMLTARGEEVDRVLGLEIGADDYVTKPFSPRELMARVKAILRRLAQSQVEEDSNDKLSIGVLKIIPSRYRATFEGIELELTPKEFELLYMLALRPGKVFTRNELLEKVWGYEYMGDTRTVDVHIRRLRKKMEEINPDLDYIETIRGVGYRFRELKK
ncbi:DNA-binding response regulator [Anoxybacter fermentans]|uniref:Stage 0 sporulation protein A homolog n=1 Tax=Anoxybacter fermentans TaxID=1323375 RepID=A0A3S9T1P2_9FIRM|nr:response regulator transcription factor [Anoxybacter fermentans]AZR74449.1 DNA-binding response regulator [Anoxybacter fermentans]